MKHWLTLLCCSVSFLLLTGCASLNFWAQPKSPPPTAAPPPVPVSPPPAPAKEISLDWVYFEHNKAALSQEAIGTLDEAIRVLEENPDVTIELAGHTDGRGSDGYNQKLSERRVRSVHQYLISEGISEDRVKTSAFGKANPVADDKTERGRAKNRRVEIRIIK